MADRTSLDLHEMACSSSVDSWPAPGISRSMTYLGMAVLLGDGSGVRIDDLKVGAQAGAAHRAHDPSAAGSGLGRSTHQVVVVRVRRRRGAGGAAGLREDVREVASD